MVRIDQWGHRWRAESADVESWARVIASKNESSQEKNEVLEERLHEPPHKPGTVVPWQPMSWSSNNCEPGRGKEEHLWDNESRREIEPFIDRWESTAVRVIAFGVNQCSGVILNQEFVLTAAHCVTDLFPNPIPPEDISVCRFDETGCLEADTTFIPSSYDSRGDWADDWALIKLESTWRQAGMSRANDMDMSRAGDGTLDSLNRVKNLGAPIYANNCTWHSGGKMLRNDEFEPVAATYSRKVRLKIDHGRGQSGGPIYYCPGGNSRDRCETGDKAYVFAVFAGHNSLARRIVGPKVASFRDTALAVILD